MILCLLSLLLGALCGIGQFFEGSGLPSLLPSPSFPCYYDLSVYYSVSTKKLFDYFLRLLPLQLILVLC